MRKLVLASWQRANLLTVLLWPLSLLYRSVFALNKALYVLGIKSVYRAPVPVVVVGNLTVGGTGKTPVVIFLVEQLRAQGYSPGVISRGYHSEVGADVRVVDPTNTPEKNYHVQEIGDEPMMIVGRTQVPMAISSDRKAACQALLAHADVDIIISDDGLQHHALSRDVEICLLDATTPQRNYCVLPAGPYRESTDRLSRVDLCVVHGDDSALHARVQKVIGDSNVHSMQLVADAPKAVDRLSRRFKAHRTQSDVNHYTAKKLDASKLVHAVAGIANPQRFFDTCARLGYTIEEHAFADHHAFSKSNLDFGVGEQVLMTEKDAVKCLSFNNQNHWYLPVNAEFDSDFITALIALLNNSSK